MQVEWLYRPVVDEDELRRTRAKSLVDVAALTRADYPAPKFMVGARLLPEKGKLLLTGKTGTGKSIIALHLAAALATGKPFLGLTQTHKGPEYGRPKFPVLRPYVVVYVDYELPHAIRAEERLKPLARIYETPEGLLGANLMFAKHPTEFGLQNVRFEDKGAFARLFGLVDSTRPDVVVLDPFSSTHTFNENSSEVKQALNNADALIDWFDCSVVLVHHASSKEIYDKDGRPVKRTAIERGRGHTCVPDWCDTQFYISRTDVEAEEEREEDGDETIGHIEMTCGKCRHGRRPGKHVFEVDFKTMRLTHIKAKRGAQAKPQSRKGKRNVELP